MPVFRTSITINPATSIPAWINAMSAGVAIDVAATNLWSSVIPAGVSVYDPSGDYVGWALLPDWGTHGGVLLRGGGHSGSQTGQTVVFDVATRTHVAVGSAIQNSARTYANGSELQFQPSASAPPSGTGIYLSQPIGQDVAGSAPLLAGWYRRTLDLPASRWPGEGDGSQFIRKAGRFGEVAPNVPADEHTYDASLGLPGGVLGGGAQGLALSILKPSWGPGSGNYVYASHKQNLNTGVWSRMVDEFGPQTYFNTKYAYVGGDNRYRVMTNQPNEHATGYDAFSNRVVMRIYFDKGTNRALAYFDTTGANAEIWEVMPTIDAPSHTAIAGCLVPRAAYGVWVDLASNGTLWWNDARRGPLSPQNWTACTMSGVALPSGAQIRNPSIMWCEDTQRIAIFDRNSSWPANTLYEVAAPTTPTGTWVVTSRVITGVTLRAGTANSSGTFRKLIRMPKAGIYIWRADSGAPQAFK